VHVGRKDRLGGIGQEVWEKNTVGNRAELGRGSPFIKSVENAKARQKSKSFVIKNDRGHKDLRLASKTQAGYWLHDVVVEFGKWEPGGSVHTSLASIRKVSSVLKIRRVKERKSLALKTESSVKGGDACGEVRKG